jgi:hypothetical protein
VAVVLGRIERIAREEPTGTEHLEDGVPPAFKDRAADRSAQGPTSPRRTKREAVIRVVSHVEFLRNFMESTSVRALCAERRQQKELRLLARLQILRAGADAGTDIVGQ